MIQNILLFVTSSVHIGDLKKLVGDMYRAEHFTVKKTKDTSIPHTSL